MIFKVPTQSLRIQYRKERQDLSNKLLKTWPSLYNHCIFCAFIKREEKEREVLVILYAFHFWIMKIWRRKPVLSQNLRPKKYLLESKFLE